LEDIEKATSSTLENICNQYLNYADEVLSSECTDVDKTLTKFVIENTYRDTEGRLVMPALWNEKVKHLLPNNYRLALNILHSVHRKFQDTPNRLKQIDDVIKQQLNDGIIEPVEDIQALKNSRSVSFLAHNAVFREKVDSTKCRVVFLSNLCEKGNGNNLSHNQISLPGPQLNTKSWIALTLLRYNKYVMLYDLEKAFLQLKLRPEDSEKLLFLWFHNVSENDFKVVGYKFLRVPFGLRFSPTLLMLSLYIQLILHADENNNSETEIRNMLYNLAYMDNLGYSSSNSGEVMRAYEVSQSIFNSYGFNLQQFSTNCPELNHKLVDSGVVSGDVKLFGLVWNTSMDTFRTRPRSLNVEANTKRSILSTLNSNYDPLGITLPTLNRAKIFMHELQMDADLPWGKIIDESRLKNWRNIAKQINSSTAFFATVCRRL
jgi:hypothetical protein